MNSVKTKLGNHNVELVPYIHDSYRMTLRQQKQHEEILSVAAPTANVCSAKPVTGQVKLKVSLTKRPTLTKRRADSADWDKPCPTTVGSCLSGKSGKPPLPLRRSKRGGCNSQDSPDTARKKKDFDHAQ
jgi:hypothetical protein